MPTKEPKTPVTRTLPPVDVVVGGDSDPPPSSGGPRITASDIDALRRGVRQVVGADSDRPRPSLRVRAAQGAKSATSKSPWIALGLLLAEVVRYVLSTL